MKNQELTFEALGKTMLAGLFADALTAVEATLARSPEDDRRRKIVIEFAFEPGKDASVIMEASIKRKLPSDGIRLLGTMKDEVLHVQIQEALPFGEEPATEPEQEKEGAQ